MKHTFVILTILIILVLMIGIAVWFPASSIPVNSDFSAIYNTDLALAHRIPIYDLAAVRAFVQPRSGLPNEAFFLARFPYPAWYALSTFYLGILPAQSAATLWLELNLAMLLFSAWLLTDGWPATSRLVAFPAALLFFPVLGALVVGQYDFPVLLGASLLLYGLKKENMPAVVTGAVLVTFKPHIGALIFLFLLIWLLVKRNDFGRQAIKYISLVICGLVLLGFLADPHWISGYVNMLLSYQNEGNVTTCSECISLPMLISRWFFDGSLKTAVIAGGMILIVLAIFFYYKRASLLASPVIFITTVLIITLLVSPYFYNYDFILILIPFSVLFDQKRDWTTRIVLGFCYFVPYVALGLYGRKGNISLVVITLIVSALFYLKVKSIDVPVDEA